MGNDFKDFFVSSVKSQEEGLNLMRRLVEVAQASTVFSEPITSGDYTVITAAEVSAGLGFGFGEGGSPQPDDDETAGEGESQDKESGVGVAGGGGGGSMGRPVAAITIGPHGVEVQPVVDPTKIALAFFTMLGSIFMLRSKMRAKALKGK